MYKITKYSKDKAKALNVTIKPSKNPKKIDVYKNNKKVASIGNINYYDYPSYIKKNGISYADQRRKLYKIRHNKDRSKIDSPGYYADKILW
jgi:hypothetical protein